MSLSTGTVDETSIDYQAVCEHLQNENEELRATLARLYTFTDTFADIKHIGSKIVYPFRKNPYLIVVTVYAIVSILDLILRSMKHER